MQLVRLVHFTGNWQLRIPKEFQHRCKRFGDHEILTIPAQYTDTIPQLSKKCSNECRFPNPGISDDEADAAITGPPGCG